MTHHADIVIATTHVVVNAFIARGNPHRCLLATTSARRYFILGGLAPDMGLMLLSAGAAIYYPVARDMTLSDTFEVASTELFFDSALWIVVHNTLHAPLVLVALAALASTLRPHWRARLNGFIAGCAVHTIADIAVHHNDGPLVGFPINWTYRIRSPLSYWDPAHFGLWIRPLDLFVTFAGTVALLAERRRHRNQRP